MDLVEGDANEGLALSSYKEDDLLSLVHVLHIALQMHWDLLNHSLNKTALFSEGSQMQVTSVSVYVFWTLLLGEQEVMERIDYQEQCAFIGIMNVMKVLAFALFLLDAAINPNNILP